MIVYSKHSKITQCLRIETCKDNDTYADIKDDWSRWSGGKSQGNGTWVPQEKTVEQCFQDLESECCHASIYKDNHKKKKNFIKGQLVVVDFDKADCAPETILAHPLCKKYLCLLQESGGSAPGNRKYHLVFPLMKAVEGLDEFFRCYEKMYAQFPEDPFNVDCSGVDKGRYWLPGRSDRVWRGAGDECLWPSTLLEMEGGDDSPIRKPKEAAPFMSDVPAGILEAFTGGSAEYFKEFTQYPEDPMEAMPGESHIAHFNRSGHIVDIILEHDFEIQDDFSEYVKFQYQKDTKSRGLIYYRSTGAFLVKSPNIPPFSAYRERFGEMIDSFNALALLKYGGDVGRAGYALVAAGYGAKIGEPESAWPVTDVYSYKDKIIPPVEWIVEGYLSKNETLLMSGTSGVGKSFFRSQLALAIATGSDFFGHQCKKCRVLIMQNENTSDNEGRRFQRMMDESLIPLAEGELLTCDRNIMLKDQSKQFEHILDTHKPEVIFLDCLATFHSEDENKAVDMRRVLDDSLKTPCRDRGVSVTLVHHHRKPGKNEPSGMPAARGSSVISDWAGCHVILDRSDEEGLDYVKVTCVKSREGRAPSPMFLCLDHETGVFIEDGDILSPKDISLLLHVRDNPGCSQTELRTPLGLAKDPVLAKCRKLVEARYLSMKREGAKYKYSCSERGLSKLLSVHDYEEVSPSAVTYPHG